MVIGRQFCVRTSDGTLCSVHEWFIKLSKPLTKLVSLIPQKDSAVAMIPNPNPPYLPRGITAPALNAVVTWCYNHSHIHGEEWRQWESTFYSTVQDDGMMADISLAARSLKIRALRESLKRRRIRMVELAGDQSSLPSPATMQGRVANTILSGGGRAKRKRRKSTPRSPSRLRNMSCT